MKKIVLTLALIFFVGNTTSASDIIIEAEKQTIKQDINKGFFSGDVQVQINDTIVRSPRAELDFDPKTKKPSLATFFDNPFAFENKKNKKHEIKAQILKVSLIKKTITAIGDSQSIMLDNRQPILTINADEQSYDTNTKIMTAKGGVIVNYQDITTFSDEAIALIDKDNNIKNLKLIGSVVMKDGANTVKGDKFEYRPEAEEFQVSGNTSSDITLDDGARIFTLARYQQFNKKTNNLIASGEVDVTYKDYKAKGPKAQVIVNNKTNKPEKIIFTGRSRIENDGSTVDADKITMVLEPKEFYAEGNVRTSISQNGSGEMMP